MGNMSGAFGSADREMAIIEESIDYRLNELKQTWVSIIQTMLDKDTLNDGIKLLTQLSEAIEGLLSLLKNNSFSSQGLLNIGALIFGGVTGARGNGLVSYDKEAGQYSSIFSGLRAQQIAFNKDTRAFISELNADWDNYISGSLGTAANKNIEDLISSHGKLNASVAETARTISNEGGTVEDFNKALNSGTKAVSGYSSALNTLGATLANMALMWVISEAISLVSKLVTAMDDLMKKAYDVGQEFDETEKSIDGYKDSISKLYEKINDSNTSYEEAKEARIKLMGIQDELIEKYGGEEEAIKNITEAIYGNADALDYLSDEAYEKMLRDLEGTGDIKSEAAQLWNQLMHGTNSKKDTLLKAFDEGDIATRGRAFSKQSLAGIDEDLLKQYGFKDYGNQYFLSGNIYDARDAIKALYSAIEDSDVAEATLRTLDTHINILEEDIKNGGKTVEAVVLKERILGEGASTNIEDEYIRIQELQQKYADAFAEEKIEEAESVAKEIGETYKDVYSKYATDGIDKEEASVLAYLRESLPAFKEEMNKAVFEDELDRRQREMNNGWKLQGVTLETLAKKIKEFGDYQSLELAKGTEEYKLLDKIAKDYGLTLESLIELLKEKGLLEGFGTVNAEQISKGFFDANNSGNRGKQRTDNKKIQEEENKLLTKSIRELDQETQEYLATLGKDDWQAFDRTLKEQYDTDNLLIIGKQKVKAELEKYVGVLQRAEEATRKAKEAEEEWTNYKDSMLAKIGMSNDDFISYVEILKQTNPELAENQELAEKTALANQLFSNSVSDLQSNFETYEKALEDATKKTPEYNDAIQKMSEHLRNLTGIDFSITDAQTFLEDKKNLENLKKAIEGDDEALHQLQADAAEGIYVEVTDDDIRRLYEDIQAASAADEIDIPVNLDSEMFLQGWNDLVAYANGADPLELWGTANLDQVPFMQALANIMQQGGATADALNAMLKSQGWNITWDVTKATMKLPRVTTNVVGHSDYVAARYGLKHMQQEVKYVEYPMEMPTNIRFENTGSTGRKTPTFPQTPTHIPKSTDSSKKGGGGGGGGGGGSSSGSPDSDSSSKEQEDNYDETFDYFERRLKVLNDAASLLDANLENVMGSLAKNTLLDAKSGIFKEEMNNYEDALNMYQQKADEAFAKLPEDIQARIKEGAVAITEFIGQGNEELVETINNYQNWADKVADVKQNLAELKKQMAQLELQKFNNIVEEYTQKFDLRQSAGIDLIQQQISLLQSAGQVIGEDFYRESITQTQKQINGLQEEREELAKQMNKALDNGVDTGSEEWLEMVNGLTAVDNQILQCKQSIEEFDNAILQLHVDSFNRVQEQFEMINEDLSNMKDLFADMDVATADNKWTAAGLAQMGLVAQEYELATKQVRQYDDEIALLISQYSQGKYSATEYAERLQDLKSKQWSAVKATEAAKDSMMELNKDRVEIVVEGINKEIEAYEKLIDAQLDTLESEKDLHEYRKSIQESTTNITDIQKQLASMANDDSQKAKALRAKLQQQLSDAQADLAEKEYDHDIEVRKEALNAQLNDYRDSRNQEIDELRASLDNEEVILAQSFETVRQNAKVIGEEIKAQAAAHGVECTEVITSAWEAGEGAIAKYGETLNEATSQFMLNLGEVEGYEYNLQVQADKTAESLAAMYSVNVEELTRKLDDANNSAQNWKITTDALGQSLINVLDRGYAIDSITNMMNAAATSADNLASAVNRASSAIASIGSPSSSSKPSSPSNNTKNSGNYTYQGGINDNQSGQELVKVYDDKGNLVEITTRERAKKKYGASGKYGYASGSSRISKRQIAWTQENGQELIVSPSDGSILTRLNKDDLVFTNAQTKNLWAMSKMSPQDFMKGMNVNVPAGNTTYGGNTMQVGSLITVNGPVNDSEEMLKIAAMQASKQIQTSFKKLSDGINK